MKQVFLLFLIVMGSFSNAQELKGADIAKLNSLGISPERYDLKTFDDQKYLSTILTFDKKRKRRKIGGIMLGSFGLLSISAGTYGLIASRDEPIGGVISGFILASGVLEMGGSIPIFISSGRKKRQRDNIVRKYKQIYEQPIHNK